MLGMDLICTVLLSPMLCEYNLSFFSVSDAETWRRGRRQIRSQVCRRLPCCTESWSDFLYFPHVLGPIWSDGRLINGFFDKLLFNSSLFLHHRAVDLLSKPRQWMERSVQPHEQLILSEVALMSQCHFRSSSCLSKGAEGQAFTQPLTIYRMLNIWEIADICICLLDLGRICD